MMAQISVNHYMNELYPLNYSSRRFLKGVCDFVEEFELLPKHYHLVLAVSGGADSMALMPLAQLLRKKRKALRVRVVYVDHQTREGQKKEQALVSRVAKDFGLAFEVLKLEQQLAPQNFEAQARKHRRAALLKSCHKDEVVFLGHHLDDSFEWWLMQQMRSSRPEQLGIPLVNGRIRRPFLCARKWQLEKLLNTIKMTYLLDPTNLDFRFERNDLRSHITPKLEQLYPKRLKNYVHRSNVLAHRFGLHLHRFENQTQKREWARGVSLSANSWRKELDPLRVESLRELVHELNPHQRSELLDELYKLLQALRNGKKGPHRVARGLLVYLWGHEVFLLKKEDLSFYRELDDQLSGENHIGSQIPDVELNNYPIRISKENKKSLKETHPLFPKFCQKLKEKGWGWQTPARAERYFS